MSQDERPKALLTWCRDKKSGIDLLFHMGYATHGSLNSQSLSHRTRGRMSEVFRDLVSVTCRGDSNMSKKGQSSQQPGGQSSARVQSAMTGLQIDMASLVKAFNLDAARSIIESLETKRPGSKSLAIIYNDSPPIPSHLAPAALIPLGNILSSMGKKPQLDIFLRCTGGLTEVPWRMVTMLREFTDKIAVIVPSFALSGATHIAIAADELVMSPFAALGSVDPTRDHPLLPKDAQGKPIPTSVEDLKHCIKFIREQLGDSYGQQNLALIISELFKYINPLALGALEQSYNLAKLISRKCLKSRKDPLAEAQIDLIIDQLAGGYFSHSFLISRSEVENDLKLPVTKPATEVLELMMSLENYYIQQFQKSIQIPNSQFTARLGGIIQIAEKGFAIIQIIKPEGQLSKLIFDPWIPFQ